MTETNLDLALTNLKSAAALEERVRSLVDRDLVNRICAKAVCGWFKSSDPELIQQGIKENIGELIEQAEDSVTPQEYEYLISYFEIWDPGYEGEAMCEYFVNEIETIIDAIKSLPQSEKAIPEREEPKEEKKEEDEDTRTFLEVIKDFSGDKDYLTQYDVKFNAALNAFRRDVIRRISIVNCCQERTEDNDSGPLYFDSECFGVELSRSFDTLVRACAETAEDCFNVLRAFRQAVPIDCSIQSKAILTLKDNMNLLMPNEQDALLYVYKRLGEAME